MKMEASLARLSVLKSYLGMSGPAQDEELKRALRAASGMVRAFCGRALHRETRTVRLRIRRNARSFVLHEFPVWAVPEVTLIRDNGEESPLAFSFDSRGIVRLIDPPELEPGVVRVTYDAGFATTGWDTDGQGFAVPEDLEQAVVHLAAVLVMNGGAVGDLRIGLTSRSDSRVGTVSYDPSLPSYIQTVIERYRARRL
jgi:uncharacterized phiE125 gp8 family phage protein